MKKFKETVYNNEHLRKYVKNKEESKNISSSDSYRKIVWVCPKCKKEYSRTPASVKYYGFSCKHCNPRFEESVYDNENMRMYVKDKEKSKSISSSSKEKIQWVCNICDRVVCSSPLNIKVSGFRCPECNPKFEESIYDNKYMRNYILDKEKAKITSSKSNKAIDWICPKCNHIKKSTPFSVSLNGFICTVCSDNISYPERLMIELLKQNNIKYKTQVKFDTCKFKKRLPFDFGIYDDNDILLFLVEMQGEQHFLKGYHNRWDLNSLQQRDDIKRKYCNSNNINLITIDCRTSDFNFIIENIKNTDLKFLLDNVNLEKLRHDSLFSEKNINIDELINLTLLGTSYTKIARYFDTTPYKIINLIKKLNYYNKNKGKKHPVICLDTKFVYDSVTHIPDRNDDWLYVEDYIKLYGFNCISCNIKIK